MTARRSRARALILVLAAALIAELCPTSTARAASDPRRKILTSGLGRFIAPPTWAPVDIDGRYIPWGQHATNETLRATTQTGAVVPSLVDGYYERYYAATNYISAPPPALPFAMTNSLRFVEHTPFVTVRELMRPTFLDMGGYELGPLLVDAGWPIQSPPISTAWDDPPDFPPSDWLTVFPRLKDLRYDGIIRPTPAAESYPREHLHDWLDNLDFLGADVAAKAGAMLGAIDLTPLGAQTNYPATRTGGLDLGDLMVWWRGGARADANSWLRSFTNRTLRLDWNAAGSAAYLMSQMDRSYYVPSGSLAGLFTSNVYETATQTRNFAASNVWITIDLDTGEGEFTPSNLLWSAGGVRTTSTASPIGKPWGVSAAAESEGGDITISSLDLGSMTIYWGYYYDLAPIAAQGLHGMTPVPNETLVVSCEVFGPAGRSDWRELSIKPVLISNLTYNTTTTPTFGSPFVADFQPDTNVYQVTMLAAVTRRAHSAYVLEPDSSSPSLGDTFGQSLWATHMILTEQAFDFQGVISARGYVPNNYFDFDYNEPPYFEYGDMAFAAERRRYARLAPLLSDLHTTYTGIVAAAVGDAGTLRQRVLSDFSVVGLGRSEHAADWCASSVAEDEQILADCGPVPILAVAKPNKLSETLNVRVVFQADGSAGGYYAYWSDVPDRNLIGANGLELGYLDLGAGAQIDFAVTNSATAAAFDRLLLAPVWNLRNLVDRLDIAN